MLRPIVALLLLLVVAVAAQPLYPLGPFSRLAKYPEGMAWNGFFGTHVERGFKLFALVPQLRADGQFGRREYAGFLTLEVDGEALYPRFAQPGDGTRVIACDAQHLVVAKDWGGWSQVVDLRVGYPFAWLQVSVPDPSVRSVTWLLTGYGWADKRGPDVCQWLSPGETAPTTRRIAPGSPDALGIGEQTGGPLVVFKATGEPFQLALVFSRGPERIAPRDDGLALQVPLADGGGSFALAVLPAELGWDEISRLVPVAFARPTDLRSSFGIANGRPWVRLSCAVEAASNAWDIPARPVTPLPPTLADRAPDDALRIPTLFGDVALCPGREVTVSLEPVSRLGEVGPPAGLMPRAWREKLNRYAGDVLAHLRSQGGFTSSRGRPFYDGLTCSGLMLAHPYVDPPVRARAEEAVKRTLDLWWSNLRLDGEVGIWYFPEPAPFLPQVDYPEISGTLLWPTVQYAAQVDGAYPASIAGQIRKLGSTLGLAYDWTGAAYAHPGPEYTHIITESVTGGLVAWCALSRLMDILGQAQLADEYAARAALAHESMKLLRWQPQYPQGGVVNELFPDSIKTHLTDAWCYTMYTWFSYIPAFELPPDETYRLWSTLEREQWWLYSEQSKQRCYDFAHLMAIARFRGLAEALEKLPLFEDRPFGFDYFDSTPVYALMAYPWLAGLQGR